MPSEEELRLELMSTQIDKNRVDIERVRQEIDKNRLDIARILQEMRWEPYKAIAAIVIASAAFAGIILGVAHIIH
jgi:hypothetical protein